MINVIIGLIAVMASNILLGASLATLKNEFNKEKLINGLAKALCIVVGISLMYLCSYLNPDILVTNINGTNVNMIDGIILIFTAGIMLYCANDLIKLPDLLGVEINTSDVVEGIGTTEPTEGIGTNEENDNTKKEGE